MKLASAITTYLRCLKCGERIHSVVKGVRCPTCGGPLIPALQTPTPPHPSPGTGVWVWRAYLFSSRLRTYLSLGEGMTPFVRMENLGRNLGIKRLFVKLESRNPTGTFIDRGSATLVSMAKASKLRSVVVAAAGDLGISIPAYARKAGLRTKVFMPSTTTTSKAARAVILADEVVFTQDYEEALRKAIKYEGVEGTALGVPYNPYLIDGYRTLGYEIIHSTSSLNGRLNILVPVGNGALMVALWSAFKDLRREARFIGVKGCSDTPLIKDIYVKTPLFKELIEEIINETGGEIIEVCEDEALRASSNLARYEGVLVGPVGSSTIAALKKLDFTSDDVVVSVVSGDSPPDPAAMYRILELGERRLNREVSLGPTKIKILEVIALKGPMHPYGIWRTLRVENSFKLGIRTVYQHVSELESAGYITLSGVINVNGRKRKLYDLTPLALKALRG
jgi:threonine synthase